VISARTLTQLACHAAGSAHEETCCDRGSGGRIRTFVAGSKGQRPTVRRPLIEISSSRHRGSNSDFRLTKAASYQFDDSGDLLRMVRSTLDA
jgi:hypothetical protein